MNGQRFRVRAGVFARAHGRPERHARKEQRRAREKAVRRRHSKRGFDFPRDARVTPGENIEGFPEDWRQQLRQNRRER